MLRELKSGNLFLYSDILEGFSTLPFVVYMDWNYNLVDAVVGLEATRRKENIEKNNFGREIKGISIDLRKLKVEEYSNKLGAFSPKFVEYFFLDFNDSAISREGSACSDRTAYYRKVGLFDFYESDNYITVGLLVANHVSIFSEKHFRKSFFKGNEEEDFKFDSTIQNLKSRYTEAAYKGPAAYLKAYTEKYKANTPEQLILNF